MIKLCSQYHKPFQADTQELQRRKTESTNHLPSVYHKQILDHTLDKLAYLFNCSIKVPTQLIYSLGSSHLSSSLHSIDYMTFMYVGINNAFGAALIQRVSEPHHGGIVLLAVQDPLLLRTHFTAFRSVYGESI